MYRVILILAILNFVQPHHWCNNHSTICKRHHHDYRHGHDHRNDRFFHRLSDDIIEADNKAKTFCAENQDTTREVYELDVYKYIIGLPNCNESTIEVKIKHRVLYIKAEKQDNNKYVNVKILPDILNSTTAKWYYGNQELTIAVPYKLAVGTSGQKNCGDEINSNVFDVPTCAYDPNEAPEIDVRFSNQGQESENITENVV